MWALGPPTLLSQVPWMSRGCLLCLHCHSCFAGRSPYVSAGRTLVTLRRICCSALASVWSFALIIWPRCFGPLRLRGSATICGKAGGSLHQCVGASPGCMTGCLCELSARQSDCHGQRLRMVALLGPLPWEPLPSWMSSFELLLLSTPFCSVCGEFLTMSSSLLCCICSL